MADPFISREDLSDFIGQDVTASDKATICVDAACEFVRTATEQELYPAVLGGTVTLDGTGTDSLLLPERPVTAAGTVIEGGGTLTLDSDYSLDADRHLLIRKPGVIDSGWGTEQLRTYWWPGRQNIVVTYDHGYDEVPADLRMVALSMAARLFQRTDGNVTFEQLGQHAVRYAGAAGDFTATEQIILRKHKMAKG